MKRMKTILLILIGTMLSIMPSIVLGFEFSWRSPDNDKSLFYLGLIFGPVGTALPQGAGNALISQLFSIFNIAVLALGSIVVSYTIILSTINTAQEGEVMGRKWSSLWIPLRSAVGIAFLIPTASGYSLLQILMMEIVVHGVAAANQVWAKVVETFGGETTGLKGAVSIDQNQLNIVANNLLKSAVCAQVLNTDAACRSSMGNRIVTAYTDTGAPPDSSSAGMLFIGVQGDKDFSEICGVYGPGAFPDKAQDKTSWFASNQMALSLAYSEMQLSASEIVSNNLPSSTNIIYSGQNILYGNLSASPQTPPIIPNDPNSPIRQALDNGWLFAGSYYFVLISNGTGSVVYNPPVVAKAPAANAIMSKTTTDCQTAVETAKTTKLEKYLQLSQANSPPPSNVGGLLQLSAVPAVDGFTAAMDAINRPLNNFLEGFMQHLTTNDPRGAIPSLANIGSLILNVSQIIWFGVMIAALIIMLIACIMAAVQPACGAISAVFAVFIPLLTAVIMILWGIGALIGIYLPMVPYLVFTFTALGWVLLVIETIVAAPIVALGLVSPSGEHLGKAAPAVLLVVNIFLRPTLMVIGFVIAAKLSDVMIDMLNYGFFATLHSSVHGAGLFGAIATIGLYGGVCLAIIHECFSLIHVLPDKIVRWLGGQAEQSRVKEQMGEAKKGVEKGTEAGGAIMKGFSGALAEKADEWKKQGKGGEEKG